MDLKDIRNKIDNVDDELLRLFLKRMELVGAVTEYKRANGIPVFHKGREEEIIRRLTDGLDGMTAQNVRMLYTSLFEISRANQTISLRDSVGLDNWDGAEKIPEGELCPDTPIACQGIEGANSESACHALFGTADIKFYQSFEQVADAVERGECAFGMLPLENSLHGAVTSVYDILRGRSVFIVRSVKLPIRHSILAKKGTRLEDIREVYSHEQALAQCKERLKHMPLARAIPCENTAIAARKVAMSDRMDICAIAAPQCAQLYGLERLEDNVQNCELNYTRFICIAAKPQIWGKASKLSLVFSVQNRPGALLNVLTGFACAGINMTKIESRPIPGTDFEFMFYVDVEGWQDDEALILALSSVVGGLDQFRLLGCYGEVCVK